MHPVEEGFRQVTDQMGRTVMVPAAPRRIVSLVPSQTEWLASLGLDDEVVGITRFCVHPRSWFLSKGRVGGTKDARTADILSLRPDLVLGNKEENTLAIVEALEPHVPVWMSEVENLEDAFSMMESTAALVKREEIARPLIERIRNGFSTLHKGRPMRCLYVIWRDPIMVAGKGTFISDLIHRMGWVNVAESESGRYPEIPTDRIAELRPDIILLSSEPYPFREKHITDFRYLLPGCRVLLVDGELFTWYGSRLLHTFPYLRELASSEG